VGGGWLALYIMRALYTQKAQACFPRFKLAITEISSGNMVCVEYEHRRPTPALIDT
jgi:hypothetical protein